MGFLAALAIIFVLMDSDKTLSPRRIGSFLLVGLLEGLSIGPLIQMSLMIDPAIVAIAFVATTCVFACFTASALLSKNQVYLALGGTLGSCVTFMFCLNLFSGLFGGYVMAFNINLYFGLVVFCGYVLYDTQLIVARAQAGDRDVVGHALELFIDFIQIFVRILIILAKNSAQKKDGKKKSSTNNTSRR